jgi:hypothetical protein
MSDENLLLKSALWYARRGWYVFPVREVPSEPFLHKKYNRWKVNPVKSPYVADGFKASTISLEQINAWWSKFPNAGIGVDCGKSNLICLDLDVRDGKDGYGSFNKLGISSDGALHSRTPSGGLHIIYTGSSNSHADVINGLDVRSRGAYFVTPPSWIREDDGKITYYERVDDWRRIPVDAPLDLDSKIDSLRGIDRSNNVSKSKKEYTVDVERDLDRVREALRVLPKVFYEDYFKWVNIGMAIKSGLGDAGFHLWDEWSRGTMSGKEEDISTKYNASIMEEKWDSFDANSIGLGTIFYEAKRCNNVR